jgi:hypothetical protein
LTLLRLNRASGTEPRIITVSPEPLRLYASYRPRPWDEEPPSGFLAGYEFVALIDSMVKSYNEFMVFHFIYIIHSFLIMKSHLYKSEFTPLF